MKVQTAMMSLRMRILLGFSAVILLFLGAIVTVELTGIPGTLNQGQFERSRSKSLGDMELASNLLGQRIISWFSERRIDMNGPANSPLLAKALETVTPENHLLIAAELQAFCKSHPDIQSLALFDPATGALLANFGNLRENFHEQFSQYLIPGYFETIEFHRHKGQQPDLWVIRQIYSISSPTRIIALLVASISVDMAVGQLIWPFHDQLSRDWECIVASKDGNRVSESIMNNTSTTPAYRNLPQTDAFDAVQQGLEGMDGPFDGVDQNGVAVLAFHRQLKLAAGINWAIVLKTERALALKPAQADLVHSAILWMILFVVGTALCIILANYISKPIQELAFVAHKIELGDLSARVHIKDQADIGKLATIFNGMIDRLQLWQQDLEQQVLQRTQELRQLSARHEAILMAVPDIIMEANAQKIYTWSNRGGIEFFGDDVIGKPAEKYFVGKQNTYDIIQPLFDGCAEIQYVESLQRRKDGEVRLLAWWCKAIQDEDAITIGTLSSARDITEQKHIETEIRRLNSELEQRVLARTAQLEAANKELETFTYTVSHDLRAPLRHIDGYVGLLVSQCHEGLSEKGLHYLETIADSARRMGNLIDGILQVSRTGKAEMHMDRVDMNQILRESLTIFNEIPTDRKIEWVIGDLPEVCGDYSALRQVWVNLLENALKFTRRQAITRIEVNAREEGNEVRYWITDNGVGFDMTYASKLFGIFQRLHSQDEFEGTGVGLASVQQAILRHGGRVWAESEVGKGATFIFTIPRQHEASDGKCV